jgi:trypsin-like peptidase
MPYLTELLYGDVAQIQHVTCDLFGSGRLVGRNIILTARHVVTPEDAAAPVKEGWRVRLIAHRPNPPEGGDWTWIDADVVWFGRDKLDLALLKLHPQVDFPDSHPKLKLRIGRIDEVRHHPVRGLGFPRGAKVDNRRTLFVPSGNLDDENEATLSLGIDQAYQPESPNEDWRGFSGGAIVLAESTDPEVVWIYGVAQQVPQNFTRRLGVARLADAWNDEDFREVFKAANIPLILPTDPSVHRTETPKKQLNADALASYQSHFVRANELATIHYINDETFESSVLVPKSTLETWWRANPLTIRLISAAGGEVVGYWHILPLSVTAYRGLMENQLTERQIGSADIMTYQSLTSGSVYIYITAVSALGSTQTGSAVVILDLIAFLQLLHSIIGINGIGAQAVSDDPLNLIARFGLAKVASANAVSTWALDSRDQIDRALQSAHRQLVRLKGLIPEVPTEERRALIGLLRR